MAGAPHLKLLERSAIVSWCPEKPIGSPTLLAAGTVAGTVDITFSTNSVLEICSLDFASGTDAPTIVGSVQAPERFNRLAWSQRIQTDAAFPPMGLLAGGLADGSVCLWDPAVILGQHSAGGRSPLLAKMQKHTGAVKGLEFNSFSPNLLASGAADSDLCIWDVIKPANPQLYPALKTGASSAGAPGSGAAGAETTYIAWNRKVQHILASCSTNGTTVVWDLKRQKPVMTLRDPSSARRASILQWNPEGATQLVVASDDDRSPTLQMWDLRNSVAPLKEFVGHTKGVMGLAWSAHDPSLLLSSAKDSRNICWDVNTTDILCELPASANWNHDVQWCPNIPGVFSTASFDGHVGVYNLHACTLSKVTETMNADFTVTQTVTGETQPLRKAPAWMKRPCSVSFGFGGKLVALANNKVAAVDAAGQQVQKDQSVVTISQVVTEHELVARSEAFEAAIAGGDKTALQAYCGSKASTSTSSDPEEGETWSFLSLLFENDGRRELLRKLGFGDVLASAPAGAAPADSSAGGAPTANGVASAADRAAAGIDGLGITSDGGHPSAAGAVQEDDPGFFDRLPDEGILAPEHPHGLSPAQTPKSTQGGGRASLDDIGGEHSLSAADGGSHELEEEIQRAMIAGNYESAVESCFKAGRLADALLIANIFNSDLYKRTMHRYMKRCPRPYMTIVKANVDGDFEALVRSRPVGQWRETLALLATYTAQEDWANLCDMLANRLSKAGMHHAASLCHICAGNVDSVVAYWAHHAAEAAGPAAAAAASSSLDRVEVLQGVMEKAVVMGLATGSRRASSALADLVTSYASILAAQGRLSTALDYLEYVPGEASTTVAVLKDRIYRSGSSAAAAALSARGSHPPPFPFIREEVRPSPNVSAAATTSYQQQQAPAARAAANAGYGAYGQAAQQQAAAAQQQQAAAAYSAQAGGYGMQQAAAPASTYGAYAAQGQYGAAGAGQYGAAQQAPYSTTGYGVQQQQQQAAAAGQARAQGQYGTTQQSQYSVPAAPTSTYGATGYAAAAAPAAAASQFAPTTTGAGSRFQQQQPVQQQQQQPAVAAPSQYAANAYQQQAQQQSYQQQQQPAYAEPAAPVYQARRPGAAPAAGAQPAAAGPTPNAYTQQAPAPVSTATAYMPGMQQQQASQQPVQQAAAAATPAASYFTPTTTPATAIPHAPAAAAGGSAHTSAGGAPPGPPGGIPGMAGAAPGAPGMPGAPAPVAARPAAAPPAPAGPPATVSVTNVDTSKVPAEQRAAVMSLTNLYNSCLPLATNPAKKREMEDNSKKLGQLLWRLNAGDVSAGVIPKLLQLAQAIDAGDWHSANHIQVQMTTTDWDECGYWLAAVKRLIKMRQQGM